MLASGELRPDQTNYQKAGPIEERKWYKIIQRTEVELPFYDKQNLIPTCRKMGYRLIELAQSAKDAGKTAAELENLGLPVLPDINHKDYHKKKQAFLDRYYRISAEARRGIDSTYTKLSPYPKLPLECFKDDLRETTGWTDRSQEPQQPTPAKWPYHWLDHLNDSLQEARDIITGLDDIPDNYDGTIETGSKGKNPGKWYNQPIYCRIFCESETIQPDLVKHQDNRGVEVSAMRGQFSTPSMVKFCKELKAEIETYDYIEKIVILYFGDSDESGKHIRHCVEKALIFYNGGGTYINEEGNEEDIPASPDLYIGGIEIEVRHTCITPEQVEKYKLKGYQLEAFMTTESRLKTFKLILQNAIDDCIDEDIYEKNCPPEKYDYAANNEPEPKDCDIDNELPDEDDEVDDDERDMTKREVMEHRIESLKEELRDELLS